MRNLIRRLRRDERGMTFVFVGMGFMAFMTVMVMRVRCVGVETYPVLPPVAAGVFLVSGTGQQACRVESWLVGPADARRWVDATESRHEDHQ